MLISCSTPGKQVTGEEEGRRWEHATSLRHCRGFWLIFNIPLLAWPSMYSSATYNTIVFCTTTFCSGLLEILKFPFYASDTDYEHTHIQLDTHPKDSLCFVYGMQYSYNNYAH